MVKKEGNCSLRLRDYFFPNARLCCEEEKFKENIKNILTSLEAIGNIGKRYPPTKKYLNGRFLGDDGDLSGINHEEVSKR